VSGQRLLLRSSSTGAANGFQVSVTADADGNTSDASGLSRIVNGATTQYAQDATIKINDIPVSSSTNTFKDVVSGVTLTVAKETTSTVDVEVKTDKTPVTDAVNAFVKAYNALNDQLNELTKYDAGTQQAGLLQGDSGAIGLQGALRGLLQSGTVGSAYSRLADIGVTQALGGNLEVDATKFEAALANGDEVKNLFKASNNDATTNGVALKFKNFTDTLLSAAGLFSTKDASLKRQLEQNSDDQAEVNDKATRLETQLTRRYSALDVQLTSLNALNAYITQQVAQWNKTSSSS
jgi:flagellar hook-associated protein 2